jgi:hypothetical protein
VAGEVRKDGILLSSRLDHGALSKAYKEFVAQEGLTPVTDATVKDHIGRCIHATNYILLTPPTLNLSLRKVNLRCLISYLLVIVGITLYKYLLIVSEIVQLSIDVGLSLQDYFEKFHSPITPTDGFPSSHLGYRFLALSKLQNRVVPLANTTWMFLFIDQSVYMVMAIKCPAALGVDGKSELQIKRAVGNDLIALYKVKFPKKISKSQRKAFKVHLILFLLGCRESASSSSAYPY